jgi:hypothetical protein
MSVFVTQLLVNATRGSVTLLLLLLLLTLHRTQPVSLDDKRASVASCKTTRRGLKGFYSATARYCLSFFTAITADV